MEKTLSFEEIESNLKQFIGTTQYYKGWCGVKWTDGVYYFYNNIGAWLITDISTYWVQARIKNIPFQLWTLKVLKNHRGVLTMREDSDKKPIIRQNYIYVDLPIGTYKFFLIDGVLMLPTEY